MDAAVLLQSKRGGRFPTPKKSDLKKHYEHIKFLEKSKCPKLPALPAAGTSNEKEFLMPFAEEGSCGMSI